MSLNDEIGAAMSAIRLANGTSLAELAGKLEVTPKTLRAWECGKHPITLGTIERWCAEVGVTWKRLSSVSAELALARGADVNE